MVGHAPYLKAYEDRTIPFYKQAPPIEEKIMKPYPQELINSLYPPRLIFNP